MTFKQDISFSVSRDKIISNTYFQSMYWPTSIKLHKPPKHQKVLKLKVSKDFIC